MTTPGLQRKLVVDSRSLLAQGEIDLLGVGDITKCDFILGKE
ncbi:hypothetical protein [Cellvibrio fontiphilus]|uniref:Uncharacterized protein n=1 Tax=Cellvibrio fontiphilus TaxID=1815559 RepID=A0ABV7FM92_9GAMM